MLVQCRGVHFGDSAEAILGECIANIIGEKSYCEHDKTMFSTPWNCFTASFSWNIWHLTRVISQIWISEWMRKESVTYAAFKVWLSDNGQMKPLERKGNYLLIQWDHSQLANWLFSICKPPPSFKLAKDHHWQKHKRLYFYSHSSSLGPPVDGHFFHLALKCFDDHLWMLVLLCQMMQLAFRRQDGSHTYSLVHSMSKFLNFSFTIIPSQTTLFFLPFSKGALGKKSRKKKG